MCRFSMAIGAGPSPLSGARRVGQTSCAVTTGVQPLPAGRGTVALRRHKSLQRPSRSEISWSIWACKWHLRSRNLPSQQTAAPGLRSMQQCRSACGRRSRCRGRGSALDPEFAGSSPDRRRLDAPLHDLPGRRTRPGERADRALTAVDSACAITRTVLH